MCVYYMTGAPEGSPKVPINGTFGRDTIQRAALFVVTIHINDIS